MYLSKATLNTQHPQVIREIGSPYQIHASLKRFLEPSTERFLWRLENQDKPHLLIQTQKPPYLQNHYFSSWECRKLLTEYPQNSRLYFRLKANPTRTPSGVGKRVALYNPQESLEWLKRKAESNGFEILHANIKESSLIHDQKHHGHPLKWYSCTFEGQIRVKDPQALQHGLAGGIGSAKAFGFGLLSLVALDQSPPRIYNDEASQGEA